MDCLSIKKGCEKKSEEESNVRSLAGGQRGELLFLIKGGRCFCRVSVGPCTWHWLACINKVRTVFCSDVRQTRMLATQPICYLTSLCVLPEEKFAPNFRACIIVKNQYFYGWKKKYPPLKDVQLEKEKEKKSILYTILDVWWKHEHIWGMFHLPVNYTSIYLPYLVCYILYVHTALQQNVILKIWIIKLWFVYDG